MAISSTVRTQVINRVANIVRQRQQLLGTLAGPASPGVAAVGIAKEVRAYFASEKGLTPQLLGALIRAGTQKVRAGEAMRNSPQRVLGNTDIPIAESLFNTTDRYHYQVLYTTQGGQNGTETRQAVLTSPTRLSADQVEAAVIQNARLQGSPERGNNAPLAALTVGAYVSEVVVLGATRTH